MSLHPLLDFSSMTLQELQEKQKEYNKKLFAISGSSPLYDVVYSMKQAVDMEYQERMYMDTYKDNKVQLETVTEIGTISSDLVHPDYQDESQKIVQDLAAFYANKDSNDDKND
jgi:hypothetical protein